MLIGGAVLPRASELPEKLQPILNYNAVNISDHHWERDVLNLGRTISKDIPTVSELKRYLASRFIAAALTLPLCLTTVFMALISMKTVRWLKGEQLITMLPESFKRKIAAMPYVFI